jgi:hypothetical protein
VQAHFENHTNTRLSLNDAVLYLLKIYEDGIKEEQAIFNVWLEEKTKVVGVQREPLSQQI